MNSLTPEFKNDFDNWLNSLPTPPPTCGQCQHFSKGICTAKLYRLWEEGRAVDLHPSRGEFDEICSLYVEAVPF